MKAITIEDVRMMDKSDAKFILYLMAKSHSIDGIQVKNLSLSKRDICRELDFSMPTLKKCVDSLNRMGYINCNVDNKHNIKISLTFFCSI